MPPVLIILLIQAGLTVFVVLILRAILEKMLVDMAVLKLEVWKFVNEDDEVVSAPSVETTSVYTYKDLSSKHKQRLMKAVLKHFGPESKINFTVDKSLMGGMVVKFADEIIDCSLRNRLRQTGLVK